MTTEMIDKLFLELSQFTQAESGREAELLNCIRAIGMAVGCNHTEDIDGRTKLVQCVRDRLDPEFAWVIERDESAPSAPEYFTGSNHPAMRWSNPGDNAAAIRFSRREDAEKMLRSTDPARPHRIAEHGWVHR